MWQRQPTVVKVNMYLKRETESEIHKAPRGTNNFKLIKAGRERLQIIFHI